MRIERTQRTQTQKKKKKRNPQKKNQEKQRRIIDQVKKKNTKKNGNRVLNTRFPRGFFFSYQTGITFNLSLKNSSSTFELEF